MSTLANTELPAILVVDANPVSARVLHEALQPHTALTASDGAAARRLLASQEIALVLAAFRLPDMSGLELLDDCAKNHSAVLRLLIADYEELPEIVRARARGVVRRVIPRTARPRRVRRVVAEELGAMLETTAIKSLPAAPVSDRQRTRDLLRWTVERITRVPGAVIRELPREPQSLQLQFVLPAGARLDTLRSELVLGWSTPIKEGGEPPARKERRHPVLRRLPDLSPGCVVYAHAASEGRFVYLALLPWRSEGRVTVVIGVAASRFDPRSWELLTEAHRTALEEASEFPLPNVPPEEEGTGPGQHILEYDWIVTDSYVGQDRRERPTSFLNRFVLIGRRRRVSSKIRRVANVFVDRFEARVWRYALVYFLLSVVDTWLTLRFVRDGTVREMNPLLRPLVLYHPALFFAAKNTLAVLGLFMVARFHLFRAGYYFLAATLAGYFLLDGYWIWLLLTVSRSH